MPADPSPVERAVQEREELLEATLRRLMERMWFRGSLPEEGFALEVLGQLASSVESAAVLEAARAVCGVCAVVQYGKDTDRIRYFAAEGLSPTAWHHRQTIRQDDGSVTVWWRTCAAWAIWRRWPAAREEGRHGDE